MQSTTLKKVPDSKSHNEKVARALAGDGYKIFPCDPATKRPMSGVKWRDAATSEGDKIAAWWRKWPNAMPALPTGEVNGVSVVDLDMHDA